jgi:hypothetical protein
MSSLYFIGDDTSYISVPDNIGLNFENEDFTVEWYQYQIDDNPFPRIFQKGAYSEDNLSTGVSIEGGQFYYWANRSPNAAISLQQIEYKNKWVHFAICRTSGVTNVYMNGVSVFNFNDTNNYMNDSALVVGNESVLSSDTSFGGYIYYFHFMKGVAKYTSDFTVPTSIPSVVSQTVLLLTAGSSLGSLGNTVTVTAGTFAIAPVPPVKKPFRISMFMDNSRVYYKPNSLPSGGIGGVRNARLKARRT